MTVDSKWRETPLFRQPSSQETCDGRKVPAVAGMLLSFPLFPRGLAALVAKAEGPG